MDPRLPPLPARLPPWLRVFIAPPAQTYVAGGVCAPTWHHHYCTKRYEALDKPSAPWVRREEATLS